ncbi:MAG: MmcQ/YjbR family DNA-binding protein [Pseudomonadales bacterium]|nr:MmcQ/YjbR family DNA-binding protein [Pseudomonadales bacterium]
MIDVVREICLALPDASATTAHGMRDFRVGKKTFATFAINHHGDGRVALWLPLAPGGQAHWVAADPTHCFVPPYVGPRGWLGVSVDGDLPWSTVTRLVREAYCQVAPARLAGTLPGPVTVRPPERPLAAAEIDPLAAPHAVARVGQLRKICMALPEVREASQFGHPAWQAGKRTFCTVHRYRGRLEMESWTGGDRQALLTMDPRYRIPAYTGQNGWIALDIESNLHPDEVEGLILESYRHFALRRMLVALDGPT